MGSLPLQVTGTVATVGSERSSQATSAPSLQDGNATLVTRCHGFDVRKKKQDEAKKQKQRYIIKKKVNYVEEIQVW